MHAGRKEGSGRKISQKKQIPCFDDKTSVTTQQTNMEMRTNIDNQPAAFMKIIRHRFTLSSAPPGVSGARWSHRHEVGESGGSLDVMESHIADAVWWR